MTTPTRPTRRSLLRALLGAAASSVLFRRAGASPAAPMPTRPLGRTGFQVSLLGLGGQAALEQPGKRETALALVERALDLGVNYIDTSPVYGDGLSEAVIGEVMRTRRAGTFLASKTHDRSYDGSMRLLDASLRRLRTDHLDLWQLHNLKTDVDVDIALSRNGAVRAMERAREQGLVRFLGLTGHKDPLVLRRAMERHPFDVVLMALNAADRHGAAFVDRLLPDAVARGLGVVGMKVPAGGQIFRDGGVRSMEQAMRYVLTLPVSAVVVGVSTPAELEEDVRVARSFRPYSAGELAELEALTRPYAPDVLWYGDH